MFESYPTVSGLPSSYFLLLCTLSLIFYVETSVPASHSFTNETDKQALLDIKHLISGDPFGALSSWNGTMHFCSWQGVTCGRRHQRAIALNLSSLKLTGSLSPHIGNLTFLRVLQLNGNGFDGTIPPEVGRLFRLRNLNLANNSFQGKLPSNLSHCSDLRVLNLYGNNLIGKIPSELGALSKLNALVLGQNYLAGLIPPSFGNLTMLRNLSLMDSLLEGRMPTELAMLPKLEFLQVSSNKFSGMVPQQLYNISSFYFLSLADNQFSGQLPPDLGLTLPYLQFLYLGKNQFSGPIPPSITNASGLVQLDLGMNALTGPVPKNLGILKNLQAINFGSNPLGDENNTDLTFLTSLTNCTNLNMMWFYQSQLRGILPNSIANLSISLNSMRLETNYLTGEITLGIGNLKNLEYLALHENMLTGVIPDSIGRISKLQEFYAYTNNLSGIIPASIGNITQLRRLHFGTNFLEGSIPVTLGNCNLLEGLDLSYNHLSGEIPEKVIGLSSFSVGLSLASNTLTGSLPAEVGKMEKLSGFDISENKLSGEIPSTLENCVMLENLYMAGNFFEGTVPSSLKKLRSIQLLDISRNNFSGQIPEFLAELPLLRNLNISFNKFEGEVPTSGVFGNASLFSVEGNTNLCGGIKQLELPACPDQIRNKNKKHFPRRRVVIVTIFTLFILLSLAFLCAVIYRKRSYKSKPPLASPLDNKHPQVSYADLVHATDGFSSSNLIGNGRYGQVYKGILPSYDEPVAVKILNLQQRGGNKTFLAECEAMRNIRHRNLVKIITSISTIDFKGDDFKALIFEYMPNGNLDSWLHTTSLDLQKSKNLSLEQRIHIAIDVASALDYLHNHCQTPVVHCDIKPSNILLDNELTAHVSDFGLARILLATSGNSDHAQTSSTGIRGTIGYVPPEYGMGGEVSTQGDAYSYGILLLEMFTGKRPTDSMFVGNLDLHNLAKTSLPDRVMEIIDPLLIPEEEGESSRTSSVSRRSISMIEKCLASIVQVGVLCCANSPDERMHIGNALTELHAIKKKLCGS